MRVGINPLRGRRNAHQVKPANGALARLARRNRQVGCHGFGQLPANGIKRIERGQRVLKNRPDFLAANAAHILIAQIIYPPAIQENFTSRDPPRWLQQADDRGPGHGFAGA